MSGKILMRLNIFYLLIASKHISNVFSTRCVQRVSLETQLNASEGNVAGKGGIRNKRDKGNRRGLPKRHQSFAHTLTWCSAVYVAESVCPSPCYDLIFDLRGAPVLFPISVVSLIPPISPLPATFPSEAFNWVSADTLWTHLIKCLFISIYILVL